MTNTSIIIHNLICLVNKNEGSSLLSPAHGRAGARATSLSFYSLVPPPSEKTLSGFQQAGKKEGGLSVIPTRNFYPPAHRAEGAAGVGSGSFLLKQGSKARKNCFLNCPASAGLRTPIKRKRNFCGLCLRLWRSEPLGRVSAHQGRNCFSKKVRTSSSNCDQIQLSSFLGQFVCSLASPSARLASQISLYFGIKSKGRAKSKIIILSSRRRFGAAKPPEQKHTFKEFIEMFLLSSFFRVPLCGTTKPVFQRGERNRKTDLQSDFAKNADK